MENALAVDVGTSSIKGALISPSGEVLRRARVPFQELAGVPSSSASMPWGAQGLWNPEWWEHGFQRLLGELFPDGKVRIAGLSVSGNGPSVVPLGRSGRPLAGAMLWHDRRKKRINGDPSFYLPEIAWYRTALPSVWEETAFFLGCPEYISFLLTGESHFYTPSMQFVPHLWTRESAALYGVPERMLPPPILTGSHAGRVSRLASKRFGLPEGIPVAAGGSDFLMALLGSGVVHHGMTCDRAGTSEGINYCSASSVSHPRVRSLPHAVEGLYNIAGILSSTGLVFEWFRSLTGQHDRDYESMLQEISDVGFLREPFFFPSLHRGAVWEFSGAIFSGLQPGHGPAELGSAVVSAIGFGIRDCIEGLEEAGCPVNEMRVCGGQGRNHTWNRMKSDLTGRLLQVPELLDCELTGAAASVFGMLQGEKELGSIAESLVRISKVYEPDKEAFRVWDEAYRSYCSARDKVLAIGTAP
jgi:xylulokinase